jgi:hypothetical protein
MSRNVGGWSATRGQGATRGQFSLPLTRKDINSVLAREGKDLLEYDRENYTYRLRQ